MQISQNLKASSSTNKVFPYLNEEQILQEERDRIDPRSKSDIYPYTLSQEVTMYKDSPLFKKMICELLETRKKAILQVEQQITTDIEHLKTVSKNNDEYLCLKAIYEYSDTIKQYDVLTKHITYFKEILRELNPCRHTSHNINIENVIHKDIAKVCNQLNIKMKNYGSLLRGLCPLHLENKPSFTLYPQTNSFYCFGCCEGGNVINLVEKVLNISFKDSLAYLSQL